ncbi:MAG TPA: GreA/GreB family elongation factor [Burkholderiales bacterium]|jgi:transcription elongation factor GreB|nr:GreA/GreB family elongation factor [Burkholderiales bacterium]
MSRAFIKEDSEDLASTELPERPLGNEPNYVTPEGLAMLRAKVEQLAAEHARLKQAAADFDKPRLAELERDLRYYQARVDSAIVVDVANEPADEVHFGATVRTEDEDGKVHSFTIVGEDEADAARGKVSWRSPLAKALIGARVGDTVTWNRPAGATTLEVLEIRYPRQRGQKT